MFQTLGCELPIISETVFNQTRVHIIFPIVVLGLECILQNV